MISNAPEGLTAAGRGAEGKGENYPRGSPVIDEFAGQIGAGGFAPDVASAVSKVKELLAVA